MDSDLTDRTGRKPFYIRSTRYDLISTGIRHYSSLGF